jgi:hypothetical protein
VKNIHNLAPVWGDEPKLKMEFIQQIGELNSDDENFRFFRVNDIASDSKGNLYILDSRNFRIQVFDETITYIKTIGQRGQGPGEFQFPIAIDIAPDDNLYVFDLITKNIIKFDTEGGILESIKITLPVIPYDFSVHFSGNILLNAPVSDIHDPQMTGKRVRIIDSGQKVISEFVDPFNYNIPRANLSGNEIYVVCDHSFFVAVSFSMQNRIEKYNPDGELIFSSSRPLNYHAKSHEYETGSEGIPNRFKNPGSIVSFGIGIDHNKRIWVSTFLSQLTDGEFRNEGSYSKEMKRLESNTVFHIFNGDGIFLGEIVSPEQYSAFRVIGKYLFLIDLDQVVVRQYKIIDM